VLEGRGNVLEAIENFRDCPEGQEVEQEREEVLRRWLREHWESVVDPRRIDVAVRGQEYTHRSCLSSQ
jgi:hypothetical protein